MLKNYFLVALRNFSRQKFYALLNIIGLASGVTCTLLIYLWVDDEWQKDKFHANGERTFQVLANMVVGNGEVATWGDIPGRLVDEVINNVPDVDLAIHATLGENGLFQFGNKFFLERGITADPDFFGMFSFPVVRGSTQHSRAEKNYVTLSQTLATKLFGNDDPIGKVVRLDHQHDLTVTAVVADPTPHSSVKFDFVLPYQLYVDDHKNRYVWSNFNEKAFVRLKAADQVVRAQAAINKGAEGHLSKDDHIEFILQPIVDRYLHSSFKNGHPEGGRIVYVRMFSLVAVFILAIACINFMNMATARALTRAKEVGVRKVVGAQRKALIWQFLMESFIASAGAMAIAIVLVTLMLPLFNLIVSKQIEFTIFTLRFLVIAIAVIFATGFLSGIYPAFVLSSFQPASVLKGILGSRAGGEGLRRVLVIFQFTLTVVLMVSAVIVYDQIAFIRNKDLGFDRESVLTFPRRNSATSNSEPYLQELLHQPGVVAVSMANESLVRVNNQTNSVTWPGEPPDSRQLFQAIAVDYGFAETMNLKVVEGRSFSRDFHDTSNFMLTKTAVDVMGLNNPVGQQISLWGMKGTIVGVVQDVHSTSLNEAVNPVIMICRPQMAEQVFLRFDGKQIQSVIDRLKVLYARDNPGYPFAFTFLDDDFEKLYSSEKVTGSLVFGFTIMAMVISGLGLLGLTAYTTDRRRKEVSIRKALGASVPGLIVSMAGDFIKLTAIATLIGSGIAYVSMRQFLGQYAYHVEPGWMLYVLTALLMILISLAIVIYQVVRAASANPVESLRNE
jgi:putative ABC transport system permease protein